MKQPKKKNKNGWIRGMAERFGASISVSVIVSALISSGIGFYFANRLEANKAQIALLLRDKDNLDISQNNIFAQLGLYTEKLFNGQTPTNADDLQKSIITAQLQINRLREWVRPVDQEVLTQYSNELAQLSQKLKAVSQKTDLGPVYASAQKILNLHDLVAKSVRGNLYSNVIF